MLSLKQFLINVANSINTLTNNKVDTTTPLINFDDTAVDPLTDDGALANALRSLGVLNNVIPSGGGALYLKKVLTEIIGKLWPLVLTKTVSVTLNAKYAYTSGDKINLMKTGNIVVLTIGQLKSLPNSLVALGTIPEEYRPTRAEDVVIFEPSGTGASRSIRITVNTNGAVTAYAYGNYSSVAMINVHTRIMYVCGA